VITVNLDNCIQKLAPIVFGMISEKIRISSVRMIDITVRYSSPQISWAWAPTQAAPTVCAKVLRVSMAASGRSILSLYFLSHTA